MKECKEGIYVIENPLVKRIEKNRIWSYIELSANKTLNMIDLKNADLLIEESEKGRWKKTGTN